MVMNESTRLAALIGRQAGLRRARDMVESLRDQLAGACADHDAVVTMIKAQFDSELRALRKDLAAATAALRKLEAIEGFRDSAPPSSSVN
jgi:hypothetical protein